MHLCRRQTPDAQHAFILVRKIKTLSSFLPHIALLVHAFCFVMSFVVVCVCLFVLTLAQNRHMCEVLGCLRQYLECLVRLVSLCLFVCVAVVHAQDLEVVLISGGRDLRYLRKFADQARHHV